MLSFGFVVGIKASLASIGSCNTLVDFSHNFHLNTLSLTVIKKSTNTDFELFFSHFKMRMILDGYYHSYLLHISGFVSFFRLGIGT